MRSLLLALLCTLVALPAPAKDKPPANYRIPLPPRPDYEPLDWLVGEWTGKTGERSPEAELRLTVSYDLEKRFMIFREEISFAATPTAPATIESWLGILSPDPSGKGFLLRVFSNTGFITRYRATVERGQILLNPEGGEDPPPGWLFRRTLLRLDVGEISETVQVAPPDKPFFDYYSARLTRNGTPAAAPATPAPAKSPNE
jgi:hypothetical protein